MKANLPADPKKMRPVSRKTRAAIEALLTGQAKTRQGAAQIAGMNADALSRAINRPNARALIEQITREDLGGYGMLKATATLRSLMDDAQSEYVKADVAKHVLAIGGVKPSQDRQGSASGGISLTIVMRQPSDGQGTDTRTIDITPSEAAE